MSIIRLFERIGLLGLLLGGIVVGVAGCQEVPFPPSSSDTPSTSSDSPVPPRSLAPPYTLAILPLDNLTSNPSLQWLGRSVSEMLGNDLARWPALSVVSREALGPVLREQWLQQRGFSSVVPSVNLGNIQGVRYLLRGGVHQYEDTLKIDLQVVDVETGIIVRSLSAHGRQSDIPRIEHDLVMQILKLFNSPLDSTEFVSLDQADEGLPPHGLPGQIEKKDGLHVGPSDVFGAQSIHRIDLQLSLENMTQYRLDAYQAAAAFWQKGWSAEMGRPQYRAWTSSEHSIDPLPLLVLPIAVFMEKHKIVEVLEFMRRGGIPSLIDLQSDGLFRRQTDETGTSQLFFGHVRQPRRLFVRAFNERAELMAVYSKWDWQTRVLLQDASSDRLFFPMWPEPLIRGIAEFPASWVAREGQHVTFDMAMVPIPHEHVSVVLEPIVISNNEDQEGPFNAMEERAVLLPLQDVIRLHWNPPIVESLPVDGYLPRNTQTVKALLRLQAGKIRDMQFFHVSHDPLFVRSLEELKTSLLGYCVDCQNGQHLSPRPILQSIRLQLTLVKDLHALRFGSRIH